MPVPITFLITDLHRGGSPLILADLAPALAARGVFAPEVVSLAPLGEVADLLAERKIPVASLDAGHNRDLSILPRLVRHLKERRPALVCSILVHANMLAAMARPFVEPRPVYVHCLHTLQHRPRWHWYAGGVASRFADAFIAPSRAVIRKLLAYGPVPRPFVIPNGLDTGRFLNAVPLSQGQRRWPPNAFVVGYVGRFDPVKRLPRLIRAVAGLIARESEEHLQPIHLALVGYGQLDIPLRSLVHQFHLNGRIHFPGPTQTPERWYKSFDAFCMPSAAEGFSLSVIEAALAAAGTGVPRIMACGAPGIREAVAWGGANFAGRVSWLPEDPSVEEIAGAILKAIREMRVAPQAAVDAQRLSEVYSVRRMVEQYEAAFAAVLGYPAALDPPA